MGKGLVLFSAINPICESALFDISLSVAILGVDMILLAGGRSEIWPRRLPSIFGLSF